MTHSTLLVVLDDLERKSLVSTVSFIDGDIYHLRIISTIHAKEGDDVVAEVLGVVHSVASEAIPDGAFIDFKMADVDRVILDHTCIFSRSPNA
jgi:hypothetical protein